ncbi:chemotaxis protein CheW [Arcobacter sp. FWKO B]|uniref:chemotaxis protein CheW n=1 Tax=Arcobacter sp. FWKO B TaxID=2593672 RepID=UPI001905F019|nr:chemotaxis protein CheW [Arcobacter sp. FWKO B]
MEYLLITVKDKYFAIDVENIIEILRPKDITQIPEVEPYILGVMNIRGHIGTVVSLRKMLHYKEMGEELQEFIATIKKAHIDWVKELEDSVSHDKDFTKTLDPHKCALGQWLDKIMTCLKCDDIFMDKIKREINPHHKCLHEKGAVVLDTALKDKDKAMSIIRTEIHNHFDVVVSNIEALNNDVDLWTNSIQRIVAFVTAKGDTINILVDDVVDIISVKEEQKQKLSQLDEGHIVQFDSAIELKDGKIATIINNINI